MRWWPSLDLATCAPPPRTYPGPVRRAAWLEDVVAQLDVEKAHRYAVRDVDANGTDETFCNFYLWDALAGLGIELPKMRANQMADYFRAAPDWRAVAAADAALRASEGFPTVAYWRNPNPARSGHVALVLPLRADSHGVQVSQAGRRNYARCSVTQGFGSVAVTYATHD